MGDTLPVKARSVRADRKLVTKALRQDVANLALDLLKSVGDERKPPLIEGSLYEVIDQYGLPQEWNPEGNKGPERYIEVQIWDDQPIRKYR
ncbi:hypothetical protein [Bacillus sp. SD088]|uniref:hypothetical protein n=1 Tax=Bacillus sp. SD088 TaxID=2782012 RepID=UPI001A9718E8|nr:hypothetical protein [Bacillus sp. SD088]MBO0995565.1 hypothetical protein [Bacillus sp. SD088]